MLDVIDDAIAHDDNNMIDDLEDMLYYRQIDYSFDSQLENGSTIATDGESDADWRDWINEDGDFMDGEDSDEEMNWNDAAEVERLLDTCPESQFTQSDPYHLEEYYPHPYNNCRPLDIDGQYSYP